MKKIIGILLIGIMPLLQAYCPCNNPCPFQSCSCACSCLRPEIGPALAYDFTQPFNEKRYWIEQDEATGQWRICWQRLGMHPEFFETTNMHCFLAHPVATPNGAPAGSRCLRGGGVIVCEDTDGRITVIHPKKTSTT